MHQGIAAPNITTAVRDPNPPSKKNQLIRTVVTYGNFKFDTFYRCLTSNIQSLTHNAGLLTSRFLMNAFQPELQEANFF